MDGRVTSAGEELVARQITHLCRAAEETPMRESKIDEPQVQHGGNPAFLGPYRASHAGAKWTSIAIIMFMKLPNSYRMVYTECETRRSKQAITTCRRIPAADLLQI